MRELIATMKHLEDWSFADLEQIETLDDLIWWHNKVVENYNKSQQPGKPR